MVLHNSTSGQETEQIAHAFAETIPNGCVVAFFGDLGAGKTTFIRALTKHFGVEPEFVTSPTFQYLNIYKAKRSIYHFDLYRLPEGPNGAQTFFDMGFDEFFSSDGITCIEWAERIKEHLPKNTIFVRLSHVDETTRTIQIEVK